MNSSGIIGRRCVVLQECSKTISVKSLKDEPNDCDDWRSLHAQLSSEDIRVSYPQHWAGVVVDVYTQHPGWNEYGGSPAERTLQVADSSGCVWDVAPNRVRILMTELETKKLNEMDERLADWDKAEAAATAEAMEPHQAEHERAEQWRAQQCERLRALDIEVTDG